MPKAYDAIIVGSGTAGQTMAHKLAGSRMSVAVVEHSDHPGGTCALHGCQAKKWFYEGAETIARSRHLAGIGIQKPATASWLQLRNAKNEFTGRVPDRTRRGFEKAGIDFIPGTAVFRNARTLVVADQELTASWFVLATGAVPMSLPIEGARLMIDSTAFLALDKLPRRIVFIGGGFISFEFAHFAARLGPSNSHSIILEAGPRPLGPFDPEMVELLVKASAEEGIDVHCNLEITAIEALDNAFHVKTKDGPRFEADLVVHGAGRAPNISELELNRAGIEYGKKGITVTPRLQTTNPRVYAIGDCAATLQLARVADYEAEVAAANILHQADNRKPQAAADYTAVPSLLFTYPQYGMLGATENDLSAKGVAYRKSFAQNLDWPTYRRVGMQNAAYKLLAGDNGMLLGAHVMSDNASGLLNTLAMAMANAIPVSDLYRQSMLTPYPSRESDIRYMLKPLVS